VIPGLTTPANATVRALFTICSRPDAATANADDHRFVPAGDD
jgi:hypothetical protein